jgi:hypothetical protein
MLGHEPFFHKTFRKGVISFARIFMNIEIIRRLEDGEEERRIKVPLTYGPKEKFIYRTMQNPELDKNVKMILPRMSFQITDMGYIPGRKNNQTNVIRKPSENGIENEYTFTSVPYQITMELSIISKTQNDAQQIVEQILPFFKPEYTISINSIPELGLRDDVPITLQSIVPEINYDGDWNEQRNIIWTLKFTFPLNFYGPLVSQRIIKRTQVDFGIPEGDLSEDSVLNATPRVSRESSIVEPFEATIEEEYDILTTIEYFDDGKKFNSKTLQDEPV